MCFGIGGGSSGDGGAAAASRAAEEARQSRINSGMNEISNAFSGFDDNFYNQRAKAYTDYANPQLEDQYAEAKKALVYALSRSGNLGSSVAADRNADLLKSYNANKQAIEQKGLSYANQLKSDVNSNRSNLVNELNNTANPSAVAQSAASQAGLLSSAPAFDALGQLFTNATAGLANYASNASNNYSGLSPLLFNSSGSNNSGSTIVRT